MSLPVILLNSIFVNSDKEYYPQILFEECNCDKKQSNSRHNSQRLRVKPIRWWTW